MSPVNDPVPSSPDVPPVPEAAFPLWKLVLLFLKIGAVGFGGGMAVIGIVENEVVTRRRLVSAREFLHGVALGQVLGPFAFNAAFFTGYRRHGLRGAFLAALGFLLPSVVLVIVLSDLYLRYHSLPAMEGVLAGLGPVVIALILSAAFSAGRKVLSTLPAWVVAGAALAASLAKVHPVITLLSAGGLGLLFGPRAFPGDGVSPPSRSRGPASRSPGAGGSPSALALLPALAAASGAPATASLAAIAVTFFKVGLVFFGGGFVLVAVLNRHLVHDLGWLTPREFLDGVAVSNLTPGPIAVLATFAGFKLAGVPGALVSTAALLVPTLALMTVLCAGYERFRGSGRFADFMSGVGPAVVGLITSAAVHLSPQAIPGARALLLAVLSGVLLQRLRWHPAFVLALGAALASLGYVP